MVWTVRHRQSKESVNRYAKPTTTAPHLYSTESCGCGISSVSHEADIEGQIPVQPTLVCTSSVPIAVFRKLKLFYRTAASTNQEACVLPVQMQPFSQCVRIANL